MKKRTDCTLHPVGDSTYHISSLGSDVLLATVKKLRGGQLSRWGARRYQRPLDPWTTRSSMKEAVDYAVANLLTPDVPRETKEG